MTAHQRSISTAAATRLLDELRIQNPAEIDVELIAAHRRLSVLYRPLPNEEGHLLRQGSLGIITVDKSVCNSQKWRFVIAHELGHFELHPQLDQFKLCTAADLRDYKGGVETEANHFAAELLMPEPLVKPLCDKNNPSLHDVRIVADMFRTSLTSSAIRFVDLCPEPCAVIFSTSDGIEWLNTAKNFPFYIPRDLHLGRDTYAGDVHACVAVDDRPQLIDGCAWGSEEEIDLHEHSIELGNYGVLTFLWHKWQ